MSERNLVALGALLHDIGKFWQRTGDHQHLYKEFEKGEVGRNGLHALWSGHFFTEEVAKKNSDLSDAGLSAMFHHRPEHLSSDKTKELLARIVQTADHLAAQFDREKRPADDPKGSPRYDRLEAITERITLKQDERRGSNYYYPLQPLSITDAVFPVRVDDSERRRPLQSDYKQLWDKFVSEHRRLPAGSFKAYFESLLYLLHKYTWSIPSATYVDYPSISLYDHSRVTSALAICLYELYQVEHLEDGKFLLIEGDISGIQNFIYNPAFNGQEVHDGVARRLRGRSFYLNLLLKTLSDYLIDKLGLEIVNILWATGGHFLIIAPDTQAVRNRLEEARKTIQRWVWREWRGALGVIIGDVAVDRASLKDFGSVKEQLNRRLAVVKLQQFQTLLESEGALDEAWESPFVLKMGSSICCDTGRDLTEQEASISASYNDDARVRSLQSLHFDRIGRVLVSARSIQLCRSREWVLDERVARIPRTEQQAADYKGIIDKALIEFPELERCWLLTSSRKAATGAELCLTFASSENTGIDFIPSKVDESTSYGFELFAGEVKTDRRGHIVEFHELADEAEGANFLGVLRMDVDNLGLIFARGLKGSERSISKVANVSRMFDWFFSGYLNLLVAGRNLYTTYAGGDDLFILGAWNEVLELARQIRKDFGRFCAHNPELHISGGIALCKGKYPIARAAEAAGEALDHIAKKAKRDGVDGDSDKDSLAFLEQKVNWKRLDEVLELGEAIEKEVISEGISRKLIYQILSLYRHHIDPRRDPTVKESREDIIWIPRFLYILARNVKSPDLRVMLQQEICKQKSYIPVLAGYVSLITRNREG